MNRNPWPPRPWPLLILLLALIALPAHAQDAYRRTGQAGLTVHSTSNLPIVGQFIGHIDSHKIKGFIRNRGATFGYELPWVFFGVNRNAKGFCSFRTDDAKIEPDLRGVIFITEDNKQILAQGQVLAFPCVPL